jgi:MFS family permease
VAIRYAPKAVGTVQSGWPIGWGVAAILSTILFSLLPQETAWRVLFWIGLLPAFMVFFIRRFVDEPPLFMAAKEKVAIRAHHQIWLDIFSPEIIKTTILTSRCARSCRSMMISCCYWDLLGFFATGHLRGHGCLPG